MMKLYLVFLPILIVLLSHAANASPFEQARKHGLQARQALLQCRDYVRGWLGHQDRQSLLIPRNLTNSPYWNAQDAAADNYPFMVLTCALIDRPLFTTLMPAILEAEQRRTNRVDALPDDFSFATQQFRTEEIDMPHLIFGGSEYAKDGLMPLTEWLGPSPWQARMQGIIDSIWKHAAVETPYGSLPSLNAEINGEQMQVLSRLYWMTRNEKFKEWAFRLADYYLLAHLPTEQPELRLRDHGCEIISGLSEVYVIAHHADEARYNQYKPQIHKMLDTILQKGANADGMFPDVINPQTGEVLRNEISDNWGYNYNAFLTIALLDGVEAYTKAVEHALSNIHKYSEYPWERGSADGYADSIEGALNLLNRIPNASAESWVETSMAIMLGKQRYDGIIEGWHGDGNFARTALLYALWKTQGVHTPAWRADLCLGAVQQEGALYLFIQSDWDWRGPIHFDRPRHKAYLHMPADYPGSTSSRMVHGRNREKLSPTNQ